MFFFVFDSENYIFGKFDTFSKRLERIADMLNTMENFAGLADVKIEGVDVIVVRYKTMVEGTKKKSYDVLDHRKGEVGNFTFTLNYSQQILNCIHVFTFVENLSVKKLKIETFCSVTMNIL